MSTSEKGWLEKRKFERVEDVLKIIYYPLIGTAADIVDSDEYKDTKLEQIVGDRTRHSYIKAMTDDISKGGLSILTDKPLAIKQLVVIDLFLPRLAKPLKFLTEVRNLEGIKGGSSFNAGVKIIAIRKSDLSRIEAHIMEQNL